MYFQLRDFTNVLDNICVESKNVEQIEVESKVVVARDWEVGGNGEMVKMYKLSVIKMNNFWESYVQHGDYS